MSFDSIFQERFVAPRVFSFHFSTLCLFSWLSLFLLRYKVKIRQDQTWDLNPVPLAAKPGSLTTSIHRGVLDGVAVGTAGPCRERQLQGHSACPPCSFLASPNPGVYKYSLSKPGVAGSLGYRAGKRTPPCLGGKTGKKILSSPSGGSSSRRLSVKL